MMSQDFDGKLFLGSLLETFIDDVIGMTHQKN